MFTFFFNMFTFYNINLLLSPSWSIMALLPLTVIVETSAYLSGLEILHINLHCNLSARIRVVLLLYFHLIFYFILIKWRTLCIGAALQSPF